MQYHHTPAHENYSLFAGGQIFHAYPGQAAFPARLASELFRRCAAHLAAQNFPAPYLLYDPCCGAAAHLATIAFLNPGAIHTILASDVDPIALQFAAKNLSLLTPAGLQRRIAHIQAMLAQFGKESHHRTLAGAHELQRQLPARPPAAHLFCADALQPLPLAGAALPSPIDIIFADIPYGQRSNWLSPALAATLQAEPEQRLLENLHPILSPHTIVAIASANRHKINHHRFRRLCQLRAGKRRITLLSPLKDHEPAT